MILQCLLLCFGFLDPYGQDCFLTWQKLSQAIRITQKDYHEDGLALLLPETTCQLSPFVVFPRLRTFSYEFVESLPPTSNISVTDICFRKLYPDYLLALEQSLFRKRQQLHWGNKKVLNLNLTCVIAVYNLERCILTGCQSWKFPHWQSFNC